MKQDDAERRDTTASAEANDGAEADDLVVASVTGDGVEAVGVKADGAETADAETDDVEVDGAEADDVEAVGVEALGAATPEPTLEPAPERIQRRRATYRLLRAEVFYLLGLALFAVLALLAHYNAYFGWDLRASRAVQTIDVPGMLTLMRVVSLAGNGLTPYILATVTGLVFLVCNRRSETAGLALSAAGSGMVNSLLKMLVARPRPSPELVRVALETQTLSFPSGHVTFYVCYFGFLFFVAFALLKPGTTLRRVLLALAALPVLLVGLSRIYLGAHWPSDTLGAYLIGGLWLAFSLHMYRGWKRRAAFKPALHTTGG